MANSSGLVPSGKRIHANVDFAKLAGAARLLLVPIAALGVGLDRFAIRNLRLVRFDFDLVAALEPLAKQLQVQLAHAGEHHLLGFLIVLEMNGSIFLRDLVQRAGKLRFVAARLRRDGQADHRRRKLDRRQLDFAQRRARVQVFGLGDRHDVAGNRLIDGCRFVSLHRKQRPDLDALARAGRMHRAVLLQRAGEHANVAQPLHERIDPRLEHLRGERRVRIAFERDVVAVLLAVRAMAVGGSDACVSTASNSSSPMPIFVETQTIGVSVPLPHRFGA